MHTVSLIASNGLLGSWWMQWARSLARRDKLASRCVFTDKQIDDTISHNHERIIANLSRVQQYTHIFTVWFLSETGCSRHDADYDFPAASHCTFPSQTTNHRVVASRAGFSIHVPGGIDWIQPWRHRHLLRRSSSTIW